MSAITITREQLYERVWAEPATTVAKSFGISSVAVKKMCMRMNVPTPPRGYWARLAVGLKTPQTPLPKLIKGSGVVESEQIDAEKNALRDEAFQADSGSPTPTTKGEPVANRLLLPVTLQIDRLHPNARAVHAALMKGKPDHRGLVHLESAEFPPIEVTKASAERTARVLHVIYSELELRGVELKLIEHYNYPRLGFVHGPDKMVISIEETFENIRREPTPEELRRPSSEWKLESYQATGLFRITLSECHGTWSVSRVFRRNEGPRRPIELLLYETVKAVWHYFTEQDERREQERIKKETAEKAEIARREAETERQRVEAERMALEEKLRKEAEQQKIHKQKLEELAGMRVENLLRAAEWWRLQRMALDYVSACELHWTNEAGKQKALTDSQRKWLAWARTEIQAMPPDASGYPDSERDGAFDPTQIPFGGPYPDCRELPLPPTFLPPRKIADEEPRHSQPPAAPPPASPVAPPETPFIPPAYVKPQFPFWLLHRNRR